MRVYHYSDDTNEFIGESDALPDPLENPSADEEGIFLIPRGATEIPVLEYGDNQTAVFNENNQSWSVVDDFRGVEYWNAEGERFIIQTLADVIPDGVLLTEPPQPIDILKEQKLDRLSLYSGQAIIAGSVSEALGSAYFYPTNADAQSNLQALLIAQIDSVFLCRDSNGVWDRRPHTVAQLQQIFFDGMNHKQSIFDELDQRRIAVANATSETELNAISEDF